MRLVIRMYNDVIYGKLYPEAPAKLRTCRPGYRLDIPEDAHQGGVITSQTTPVPELGRKSGGGRIFEGGVLADQQIV